MRALALSGTKARALGKNWNGRHRRLHRLAALLTLWLLALWLVGSQSGCALGQLRGAIQQHAVSTRMIAGTITKAAASIHCPATDPACAVAVQVLQDQAQALSQAADQLAPPSGSATVPTASSSPVSAPAPVPASAPPVPRPAAASSPPPSGR